MTCRPARIPCSFFLSHPSQRIAQRIVVVLDWRTEQSMLAFHLGVVTALAEQVSPIFCGITRHVPRAFLDDPGVAMIEAFDYYPVHLQPLPSIRPDSLKHLGGSRRQFYKYRPYSVEIILNLKGKTKLLQCTIAVIIALYLVPSTTYRCTFRRLK
jgi:hypothetical protein